MSTVKRRELYRKATPIEALQRASPLDQPRIRLTKPPKGAKKKARR